MKTLYAISQSINRLMLLILILWPFNAYACNPNEECSRCLAYAPRICVPNFPSGQSCSGGQCIQRINDPVCEGRKKICQHDQALGDLFRIYTDLARPMPFGDANTCLANLSICPQAVQNRIEVAKACIQNIPQCPQQIVARAGYEVARPIVDSYIASLRAQAVGKYRSLPDAFVQSYQRFYTVDLHSIQYATGIDTVHGNAITIGTEIYFPWAMDLNTLNSSALMFHELEHTVQYRNRGGIEPFLAEYIAKSFGKIIQRKSFDIHDDIDIEGAAIAKSKEVVNNGYCSPERGPPAECR